MLRFLVLRAIGLIFVMFAISFITFILGYLAPTDPIYLLLGQHYTHAEYVALKHVYGLDLPWWQQYYNFVVNALRGNFGLSYEYRSRAVWDILGPLLPTSLELGLEALTVTLLLGVPSGIICALRANSAIDTSLTTFMLVIYVLPDYILIVIFQVVMVWLYLHNYPSLPVAGWDSWQSRIGPVFITASTGTGYYTRLVRTSLLEVLGQDYIRTARAKGMTERIVIYVHAFRNACLPLITVLGPSLAYLVAGLYFAEALFNIPGIANITLTAIQSYDYPVIQATTLLFCSAIVIGNAVSDVVYALVDPRIGLQ